MGLLAPILNALRGYRRNFNPFEMRVLSEVRCALPQHVRVPFDERVKGINRIQPLLGGLEIDLYDQRAGNIRFPDGSRILATNDSMKIATVDIDASDETSRLQAELYCCNGMLTSIEFNGPSEHAAVENVLGLSVRLEPGVPWIGNF